MTGKSSVRPSCLRKPNLVTRNAIECGLGSRRLVIFVALMGFNSSGLSKEPPVFERLVVLGDSLSDMGNAGRFSNGPVWVEQLAQALKLPLKASPPFREVKSVRRRSPAVLIRSVEGIKGPGRLTKAIGITGELNGMD